MSLTLAEFYFENALQMRFSGGVEHWSGEKSLGGAISGGGPMSGVRGNLFRRPTSAELTSGVTQYRCLFLHNVSEDFTLDSIEVWVDIEPGEADTTISIGLDPEDPGDPAVEIADEFTAPAGVTFAAHNTSGTALTVGTLEPGEYKAFWVRRVLDANHPQTSYDRFVLAIEYEEGA